MSASTFDLLLLCEKYVDTLINKDKRVNEKCKTINSSKECAGAGILMINSAGNEIDKPGSNSG